MALPTSPSTTYVPNSLPVIKAQDLNDLQKYLAGLYTGSYTVGSILCEDPAGSPVGAPVAAAAGAGVFTARVSDTAVPSPVNYRSGTAAVGTLCQGWAVVNGNATLARGVNVYSVGRTPMGNSAGDYLVVFNTAPSDRNNLAVSACILDAYFGPTNIGAIPTLVGSKPALRVQNFAANVYANLKFSVSFYAE